MLKKKKVAAGKEEQLQVPSGESEKNGQTEQNGQTKKKLPGWVIIPIIVVITLILWGISAISGGKEAVAKLSVIPVQKGDVKEVYRTSGTIESEKSKVFYSPVNAPILSCMAKRGEAVKAGDVLITYDVTNLERENEKSQMSVLSTQYSNQDAKEQSSRSQKAASQAAASQAESISRLKTQIQEKQNEVNALQAIYEKEAASAGKAAEQTAEISAQMQTNLNLQNTKSAEKENMERELANLTALYPDKSEEERAQIQKDLVEDAAVCTKEIEDLKIAYRELEQKLAGIGGGQAEAAAQNLAAANQELASLKAALEQQSGSTGNSVETGLTGSQLKNMQISENLAELAALGAKELVEKGREGVKAEFDGIISDVKAIEGSPAVQGGELFTLVSSKDLVVRLEVSASDYEKLNMGGKAEIQLGQSTYTGTITAIDRIALPNAKGNPVVGAEVHIDNPDENICIGVTAKVNMTVAEKKQVLCLPSEVVNTGTDGDFVYVIRSGVVKKQPVTLGVASSSQVEITEGLSEGDQVVADTLGTVKEGMKASAVVEAGKK